MVQLEMLAAVVAAFAAFAAAVCRLLSAAATAAPPYKGGWVQRGAAPSPLPLPPFAFAFVLATVHLGRCSRETILLVGGIGMSHEHIHLSCCLHRRLGLDSIKEACG